MRPIGSSSLCPPSPLFVSSQPSLWASLSPVGLELDPRPGQVDKRCNNTTVGQLALPKNVSVSRLTVNKRSVTVKNQTALNATKLLSDDAIILKGQPHAIAAVCDVKAGKLVIAPAKDRGSRGAALEGTRKSLLGAAERLAQSLQMLTRGRLALRLLHRRAHAALVIQIEWATFAALKKQQAVSWRGHGSKPIERAIVAEDTAVVAPPASLPTAPPTVLPAATSMVLPTADGERASGTEAELDRVADMATTSATTSEAKAEASHPAPASADETVTGVGRSPSSSVGLGSMSPSEAWARRPPYGFVSYAEWSPPTLFVSHAEADCAQTQAAAALSVLPPPPPPLPT